MRSHNSCNARSGCHKHKARECIKCHKRFKTLTEEELCFGCHLKKYGKVAKEWQTIGKGSNQPMTFKGSQGRKKRAKGQPGGR